MAVVLLGVPRGQNFVAEAADEATKSVALLTLTLTGDEEEPLTAKMEWKSFVPGTTVGLEVVFVDEDGTAWGPCDFGTWLDTYGSMKPDDAEFTTFAPTDWLAALPAGTAAGDLFGESWDTALLPFARSLLATRDWIFGILLFFDPAGSPLWCPGLVRVALGGAFALSPLVGSFPPAADFPPLTSASAQWSCELSDSSVAAFDAGSASVRALSVGSASLDLSCRLTWPDGQGLTWLVGPVLLTVYDPSVPVGGVSLSETTKTLAVGKSFDLTATVSPADATNKKVTWKSGDETVATVSGDGLTGTVKALKAGTTTITVTTDDGNFSDTCKVKVTSDDDDPEDPDDPAGPDDTDDPSGYPAFGSARPRAADGRIQYVNSAGRTAVPLDGDALDDYGILWLHEESAGSTAWYGLDLSTGAFELTPERAFYVQWLSPSDAEYDTYYSQLDDAQKARVEHDNGWIFLLGVTDISGNKIQPASPVNVYVQIGDDWDVDNLNAYYIASGADESVPVDYLLLDYPEGSDTFGRMTLDHFSPYFIFDELTADEKATLVQENSGPKNNVKTGDLATQMTVAGLGMTLVLALGIMLRLITSERKFEE